MDAVGIIANPASGKDIRRLVAYGTVFDNQEKVNIVRRVILGLAAVGIKQVVFMPDYFGIIPKAIDGLNSYHRLPMEVTAVEIDATGTQVDTLEAAARMKRAGVGCIVTLGGDGTNRMVAKGCGGVPLLPISTGTNNVFPSMMEGTIAGLAAGAVAQGMVSGPPAIYPTKMLEVYKNGEPVEVALIDAVILRDQFIGSRAVWDPEKIQQLVVTKGEPHNIGISSIAGNLEPIGAQEERGLVVEFGGDEVNLAAPIAPGLIEPLKIKSYRTLQLNEEVKVESIPCIIALDGEREVELKQGDEAYIKLTGRGPLVIDVRSTLREAARQGYLRRKGVVRPLSPQREE